jgi:hypothetical protein
MPVFVFINTCMKKTFATLAEFKRALQPGDKLHCINHTKVIGRDEQSKPVYGDFIYPIRECTKKQSNSFAFATETPEGIKNSWCDFPAASMCKIEGNKLIIYEKDLRNVTGGMDNDNPDYKNAPLVPVITYWFAD